jgi:hypothetical protein
VKYVDLLITAINSPNPIYMIPQKCTLNACCGFKLDATIPAVGAVKITGNMGNIHAGVMFAALRWWRFVKRTKYINSAKRYASGAYIQNTILYAAERLLPCSGLE